MSTSGGAEGVGRPASSSGAGEGSSLSRLLAVESRLDAELEATRARCAAVVERARACARASERRVAELESAKRALERDVDTERHRRLLEIEQASARSAARCEAITAERAEKLGRELLLLLLERVGR